MASYLVLHANQHANYMVAFVAVAAAIVTLPVMGFEQG